VSVSTVTFAGVASTGSADASRVAVVPCESVYSRQPQLEPTCIEEVGRLVHWNLERDSMLYHLVDTLGACRDSVSTNFQVNTGTMFARKFDLAGSIEMARTTSQHNVLGIARSACDVLLLLIL
jgi:hypothetical protein